MTPPKNNNNIAIVFGAMGGRQLFSHANWDSLDLDWTGDRKVAGSIARVDRTGHDRHKAPLEQDTESLKF